MSGHGHCHRKRDSAYTCGDTRPRLLCTPRNHILVLVQSNLMSCNSPLLRNQREFRLLWEIVNAIHCDTILGVLLRCLPWGIATNFLLFLIQTDYSLAPKLAEKLLYKSYFTFLIKVGWKLPGEMVGYSAILASWSHYDPDLNLDPLVILIRNSELSLALIANIAKSI